MADSNALISQDVRLAAIKALINSLDFIKENFEREVRVYSEMERGKDESERKRSPN